MSLRLTFLIRTDGLHSWEAMWRIGENIGSREGRFDIAVAAAGVLKNHINCLQYPAKEFQEVSL